MVRNVLQWRNFSRKYERTVKGEDGDWTGDSRKEVGGGRGEGACLLTITRVLKEGGGRQGGRGLVSLL